MHPLMFKCHVSHVPPPRWPLHQVLLQRWHMYLHPHAGPHRLQSTGNIKSGLYMAPVSGLVWNLGPNVCFVWKHQRGRSRLPTTACTRWNMHQSLTTALSNFLLQQEEIIKAANVNGNGRYMMHNCAVNCLVAAEALPGFGTGVFTQVSRSSSLFFFNLVLCHFCTYEVEKSKFHCH